MADKKSNIETDDEFDFSPIESTDEFEFVDEKKPSDSAPVAAAKGALQGLTFGAEAPIVGGLGAVIEGVKQGDLTDLEKLKQRYAELRDFAKKDYEQTKEESPILTTGSEIAGSIASPISRGIGVGVRAAGITGPIVAGATEGALAGATQQVIAGQDIGTGAALGGAIGGAVPLVGKGLSALASVPKAVGKLGIVKNAIVDPYQVGKKGVTTAAGEAIDISSEEGRKQLGQELIEKGGKIHDELTEMFGSRAALQKRILDEAEARGEKIDISKLDQFLNDLKSNKHEFFGEQQQQANKLTNLINSVSEKATGQSIISPNTAQKFKQAAQEELYDKELYKGSVRKLGEEQEKVVRGQLEAIPGYQDVTGELSTLNKALEGVDLNNATREEFAQKFGSTIGKLEEVTKTSDIARRQVSNFIKSLEKVDPAKAKLLGEELGDVAKAADVSRQLVTQGSGAFGNILASPAKYAKLAAYKAGSTVKKLNLDNMGQSLKPGSSFAPLVEKLKNSDAAQRRAMMFQLLQQPAFRAETGLAPDEQIELED